METKSKTIQFGLIWGTISVILGILMYVMGSTFYKNWVFGILILLVSLILGIVIMAMSSKAERKRVGGFITFQNAFSAAYIPSVIAIVIGLIFNILLFKVIDKEYPEQVKKWSLEMTESMLEKFGVDEDTIEYSLEEAERKMEKKDQFGFKGLIRQSITGLIIYGIVGLIIAAIIRKKEPDPSLE